MNKGARCYHCSRTSWGFIPFPIHDYTGKYYNLVNFCSMKCFYEQGGVISEEDHLVEHVKRERLMEIFIWLKRKYYACACGKYTASGLCSSCKKVEELEDNFIINDK